ncbi:MAG: hypothetical protein BRD42_02090 [Bacteroidetes bacterium QS_3_64_15]|nr:MAG: hypothetical protein BRD42_02090 [Bacteroidetes bacterium QS_3_64_15]
MKRTILAGTFFLLAGAATLLLAASIFYSCRSGGHPHHERDTHDAPTEESHSSEETHSSVAPSDARRLTLTGTRSSVPPEQFFSDRTSST